MKHLKQIFNLNVNFYFNYVLLNVFVLRYKLKLWYLLACIQLNFLIKYNMTVIQNGFEPLLKRYDDEFFRSFVDVMDLFSVVIPLAFFSNKWTKKNRFKSKWIASVYMVFNVLLTLLTFSTFFYWLLITFQLEIHTCLITNVLTHMTKADVSTIFFSKAF